MLFYLFSAEELGELFARLGYPYGSDRPQSMKFFLQALQSDVADIQQGTTAEGVHLGAMAGTVDLVERVWTGIEVKGGMLRLNPELPRQVERLDMRIRYRGHSIDLRLTHDSLTLRGRDGDAAPICLCVGDEVHDFASGQTRVFRVTGKASR